MTAESYAQSHGIDLRESNLRRLKLGETAADELRQLEQSLPRVKPARLPDASGWKLSLYDSFSLLLSFCTSVVLGVLCCTCAFILMAVVHSFRVTYMDPYKYVIAQFIDYFASWIFLLIESSLQYAAVLGIVFLAFTMAGGTPIVMAKPVLLKGMRWVSASIFLAFGAIVIITLQLASRLYPFIMGRQYGEADSYLGLPAIPLVVYLAAALFASIVVPFLPLEAARVCPSCSLLMGEKEPVLSTTLGGARLFVLEVVPHQLWELLPELAQQAEGGALELWRCRHCRGGGILELSVSVKIEVPSNTGPTEKTEKKWMIASVEVGPQGLNEIEKAVPLKPLESSGTR